MLCPAEVNGVASVTLCLKPLQAVDSGVESATLCLKPLQVVDSGVASVTLCLAEVNGVANAMLFQVGDSGVADDSHLCP